MDLTELNELDRDAFTAAVGSVFEASPWVAIRAWDRRPFESVAALHDAMTSVVAAATSDEQLALIRAHPDLAGSAAIAGELTADSTHEQAVAGLDRLTPDQFARLSELNAAYRQRFGFPFVICAREHGVESIIAAATQRVAHDPVEERRTALDEIAKIARLRLDDLVDDTVER
jgi:2-oxo-4-hydroxy-4-carboxy-5-ureidoimidazoline decarboxylase